MVRLIAGFGQCSGFGYPENGPILIHYPSLPPGGLHVEARHTDGVKQINETFLMNVKPIPDGYASVTPYLIIQGAADAIEFYKNVFGATERMRLPRPDGKVAHAEIEIGGSVIMLADECPERGAKSPQTIGGTPVCLHLYVENADEVFADALAAGAQQIKPLENQFYGDRSGMFSDPFGHSWNVVTHVEDVSPEELQTRMAEMSNSES